MDCQYAIRLAQDDVTKMGLPMVGMASAVDGCEADAGGSTCNLHPGYKTGPATRLGWEMMNVLFNKVCQSECVSMSVSVCECECAVKYKHWNYV
jgi:hypothetical protein